MKAIATYSTILIIALVNCTAHAEMLEPIKLPKPDLSLGKPLMRTLQQRQSTKEYDTKPIAMETLSNLLWAAIGINRPESGKRTIATASNCQDMDIYVVLKKGVYLYQAKDHSLKPVLSRDVRALAATQSYAQKAAIQLVYVSDYSRMDDRFAAKKPIYSAFHAGSISQNVYLYCASEGLGAVVRDGVNRTALHKALKLKDDQVIVMAQTVGHPAKN